MPRPQCLRRVGCAPATVWFKPAGVPLRELEEIALTLDEFEALRLADLEGLYQEAGAERMGVSRATFGRIVESARRKVAEALVRGKALRIEGGPVEMTAERTFSCAACGATCSAPFGAPRPATCPACGAETLHRAESERGTGNRRRCRHGARRGQETVKEPNSCESQ